MRFLKRFLLFLFFFVTNFILASFIFTNTSFADWPFDATKPVITIRVMCNGVEIRASRGETECEAETVDVTLTYTDNQPGDTGVVAVTQQINGTTTTSCSPIPSASSPQSSCTYTTTLNNNTNSYTIRATARDAVGNTTKIIQYSDGTIFPDPNCEASDTCEIPITFLYSISGRLFIDPDHNCSGTTGYSSGHQMDLTGSATQSLNTNSLGGYTFKRLTGGGNYVVGPHIPLPANYTFSSCSPTTRTFNNLLSYQRNADFYITPLFSVSGNIYRDINSNGNRDASDTLFTGPPTTVKLYEGAVLKQTLTNITGSYQFTNIISGGYTVKVDLPTGFKPDTDGGAKPLVAQPIAVNPSTGSRTNIDFLMLTYKITGNVFIDYDNNGAKDATDANYSSGATLNLTRNDVPFGWWKMDEISGNLIDSSGNYTGTPTGTTVVAGKFGNGRQFNGTSDVVNTASFNPTQITMLAWTYFTKTDPGGYYAGPILSKDLSSPNRNSVFYYEWNSGVLRLRCDISLNGTNVVQTSVIISASSFLNTWKLVTCTYDGSNTKIYANNSLLTTSPSYSGSLASNSQAWQIGARTTFSNSYYKGSLDEVRIYNRALSLTEITNIYNTPSGPIGFWKMDESSWNGTAGEVKDYSGAANNGVRGGNATTASGIFGNAGTFDGSGDYVSVSNTSALKPTNAITISEWVKFNSFTDSWQVHNSTNAFSYNYGYIMREDTPSNKVGFWVGHGSANGGVYSNTALTPGTWYHVVGVFDGSTYKIYLNGNLDNSAVATGSTINYTGASSNIYLGERLDGLQSTNGSLDEVRIYDRALSGTEISDLYNAGASEFQNQTQVSNSSGNYTFTNLKSGTYRVTLNIPAGYKASTYTLNCSNTTCIGGTTYNDITIASADADSSFGITPLYSISGTVFADLNKNGIIDGSDSPYSAGTSTIEVRTANSNPCTGALVDNVGTNGVISTTTGLYDTGINLAVGSYDICYTSVPADYEPTVPTGSPPFRTVTVGTSCIAPAPAVCASGSISNLNFGITNSWPWFQGKGADMRDDTGFYDKISPSGAYASQTSTGGTAGIIFSGNTLAYFYNGAASANNWVVGDSSYPELFSLGIKSRVTYPYLKSIAQANGIPILNLNDAAYCGASGIADCTLNSELPSGVVYEADGDLTLRAFTSPSSSAKNYVFLINGNLKINGAILIRNGSTATFVAKNDITVDKNLGAGLNSTDCVIPTTAGALSTGCQIEGFFSAGANFNIEGNGSPGCLIGGTPDKRLNIGGVVVVNANRGGGAFSNQRDICQDNLTYPSVHITERIDFVLNAPDIIKIPSNTWQETAP